MRNRIPLNLAEWMKVVTLLVVALVAYTLPSTGCQKNPVVIHQGAANITDSNLYDSLLVIQAAVEEARAQFASVPAAKEKLNQAIASYNLALNAYRSYHAAALAGGVPDATVVQERIAAVTTAVQNLLREFGKPLQ